MHLPIRYPNLGANPPSQPLPTHHAVNQHMMHGNEGERTVHQGQGEAKGGLPGRLTIRALLLTHLARCMSILSILVHRACPEAKSGSLFFSRSSQNCGLRFVPTLSVRNSSVTPKYAPDGSGEYYIPEDNLRRSIPISKPPDIVFWSSQCGSAI